MPSPKLASFMSPEASSRLKLLLLAAVWLAVIGSGVAYCVCCWLLSAANGKRARALQVHGPRDIAHMTLLISCGVMQLLQEWSRCEDKVTCDALSARSSEALASIIQYLKVNVRSSCMSHVTHAPPFVVFLRLCSPPTQLFTSLRA